MAPPSQFGAHLLATTDRLRQGRGDAGAQMAGEIQRRRPRALDGTYVRQRTAVRPGVAAGPRVSRRLGRGAVPVPVRAGADAAGLTAADARVASDDRDARGGRDAERRLEAVAPGTPALSRRDPAIGRAGVPRGRPRAVPR